MEKDQRVRRRADPVTGAAIAALGHADHVDAVAIDVEATTTAAEFARQVLTAIPGWVEGLLAIRDALMRPFGLHTQDRSRPADIDLTPGARIGPFRVRSASEHEVVLGDDDKHLRFRASFAVRECPSGRREGVLTTVVVYGNVFGRVYFAAIKPFHHAIVAALVARSTKID